MFLNPLKCVPRPGKLALRPRRDPTEADDDWTIWRRSCLDPPPSVVKAFRRSTNRRELGAALKCGRCRLLLDRSHLLGNFLRKIPLTACSRSAVARYLKWLLRSVACWAHAHTESTGDTWNELTSQRHTSSRVLSKLLQQLSTVRGLVRNRP